MAGGSIVIHSQNGDVIGSSITDGDGARSVADLPLNAPIRIRVVGTPGGLNEGPIGPDSDGFLLFTDTSDCADMTIGSLLASVCSDLIVEIGNQNHGTTGIPTTSFAGYYVNY